MIRRAVGVGLLACCACADVRAQGVVDGGAVVEVTPGDAGVGSRAFVDAGADVGADAGVAPDAAIDAVALPELPAEHRPRLRVVVTPRDGIRTGDTVKVEIFADAPARDDLTVPSQSFAPFELHARRSDETARGARTEHRFELTLLALAPGELVLPPIELRVLTPDGLVGTVRTPATPIRVASRIANEPNAQPKPETQPVVLMEEDPRPLYALYALLAMLVGGLVAMALRAWWTRRPKPVPPPPPPRPAWDIAFERLELLRLDGPRMIEEGHAEAWIDSLSDVVREYLGQRYGFDGLECTTRELVARLANLRIRALASGELEVFLGECDLVKFAKGSMTVEQAEAMFRHAHRLVGATVPGPVMGNEPVSMEVPR